MQNEVDGSVIEALMDERAAMLRAELAQARRNMLALAERHEARMREVEPRARAQAPA